MAGVFHKAMVWLGLAPDEDYDDYGYDEPMRQLPSQPRPPAGYGAGAARQSRPGPRPNDPADEGAVLRPRPVPRPSGAVRPLPSSDPRSTGREETPTVRPMRPTSAKPAVVTPETFDSGAKAVADRFKAEQPVVMDLADADQNLARRLIDFSSGLCYGLGGNMEKMSAGRYLLTPTGVEVSDEERRRLSGRR